MLFGAQIRQAGGLLAALRRAEAMGAEVKAVQGAGVDRHDNVGRGHIGPAPFRALLGHPPPSVLTTTVRTALPAIWLPSLVTGR